MDNDNWQQIPLAHSLKISQSEVPRTSHDFEDIVYVMDNRSDIVETLIGAPADVKPYLTEQMQYFLQNRVMQEAIYGNLFYETREERYQRITEAAKQIVSWG